MIYNKEFICMTLPSNKTVKLCEHTNNSSHESMHALLCPKEMKTNKYNLIVICERHSDICIF